MKIIILFCFLAISCNAKREKVITKKEKYYKAVVDSCIQNNTSNFFNVQSQKGIKSNLNYLGASEFEIIFTKSNNLNLNIPLLFNKIDSLAFFITKAKNILNDRETVVYDFSKTPRRLASDNFYQNSNIEIKKLNERMYLIKEGFD